MQVHHIRGKLLPCLSKPLSFFSPHLLFEALLCTCVTVMCVVCWTSQPGVCRNCYHPKENHVDGKCSAVSIFTVSVPRKPAMFALSFRGKKKIEARVESRDGSPENSAVVVREIDEGSKQKESKVVSVEGKPIEEEHPAEEKKAEEPPVEEPVPEEHPEEHASEEHTEEQPEKPAVVEEPEENSDDVAAENTTLEEYVDEPQKDDVAPEEKPVKDEPVPEEKPEEQQKDEPAPVEQPEEKPDEEPAVEEQPQEQPAPEEHVDEPQKDEAAPEEKPEEHVDEPAAEEEHDVEEQPQEHVDEQQNEETAPEEPQNEEPVAEEQPQEQPAPEEQVGEQPKEEPAPEEKPVQEPQNEEHTEEPAAEEKPEEQQPTEEHNDEQQKEVIPEENTEEGEKEEPPREATPSEENTKVNAVVVVQETPKRKHKHKSSKGEKGGDEKKHKKSKKGKKHHSEEGKEEETPKPEEKGDEDVQQVQEQEQPGQQEQQQPEQERRHPMPTAASRTPTHTPQSSTSSSVGLLEGEGEDWQDRWKGAHLKTLSMAGLSPRKPALAEPRMGETPEMALDLLRESPPALLEWLLTVHHTDALIKCHLNRERRDEYVYFTFVLDALTMPLMLVRKRAKNSAHAALTLPDDTRVERPLYLLRHNRHATEFALQHADKSKPGDLAAVRYMLATTDDAPRALIILLPTEECRARGDLVNLLKSYYSHRDQAKFAVYQNKAPVWREEMQSNVLNFGGRVKVSSTKNFQMVAPDNVADILMQFGRVSQNSFILDFKAPLCPLQALALALSSFN